MSDSKLKNVEATRAVDYKELKIMSAAFENKGKIPQKYTCDGTNVNPPLDVGHIPVDAKCLAIIVDDPDAPAKTWVHWVCWNIPVTQHIKENGLHGVQGINDFGTHHYSGPCPPSGVHRYFFKVYALDSLLNLKAGASKHDLEKEMADNILAFGELIGLYERGK